jgi:putative YhdH/YhfP family quinone oxidoreductase
MATEFHAEFRALQVEEQADGTFQRAIVTRNVAELPPGDVLVRVLFSSLNYKDALSASGNKGVTRKFPHTPGIDAAGIVEESAVPEFGQGDSVVVIGYDLGMNTPGGYGEYIRVPAGWVTKLPPQLNAYESMMLGTAGFTAAMAVEALQWHEMMSQGGEVLVTGATGGVGSIAVALLATLGYEVVAATGKLEEKSFLEALGAKSVIHREELVDTSGKALLRERWAGVVDTVGGPLLASALKGMRLGGSVAACGNVASARLETTVFPFILRGVNLLGIDSANFPIERRRALWAKLAGEWRLEVLESLAREVPLGQLDREIERILQGKLIGRVVVAHR